MTDFADVLRALHRPKILVRAARAGVREYQRDRDLKRVMNTGTQPSPAHAMRTLLAEEDRLEVSRTSGGANYSIQRHVAVMTALLAEARVLPAPALAA